MAGLDHLHGGLVLKKIKRILFTQMESILSQMKAELDENSLTIEGFSGEIEFSQKEVEGWQEYVDKAMALDLPELANKAGARKSRAESKTSVLQTRFEQECRKRLLLEREMNSIIAKVRVLKQLSQ